MCLVFGFSFQRFLLYLFYCLKMAFVCEFQYIPLCKMIFFSRFHMYCEYEIWWTCKMATSKCDMYHSLTGKKGLEKASP
jgi:hypothetical protein